MIEFTVAGVGIHHSYDFPDPGVPGGMRRVLARWASPRQAKASGQMPPADAAKVLAKCGDLDALLWDHRDEQSVH